MITAYTDQRLINDAMQSSMASCDLQASLNNNFGRVNDNNLFQPQVMMQNNPQRRMIGQLGYQQHVVDEIQSFDDFEGNLPYEPTPSAVEDDLFSSSEF